MKVKSIFYILLASIAMLSFYSCNKLSHNGDKVVAENVRFILKEDAVDTTSANIRVRHSGASGVMWVYMHTKDLESSADKLIEERVKNEYAFTKEIVARTGTNKSLHLNGLEVKNEYRIIVKAIDRAGNLYGEAASLTFKTRRDPDVWDINENWTLERLSRTDGYKDGGRIDLENYQLSSSDSESYIFLSLSKADWQAYEKNPDHKDKIRTIFEDYHKDFVSQKDYAKRILKGNAKWQEDRLRSGDYVLFMIGLDEDNELSGLYRQFNITVEPEQPSENYTKWLGVWEVSFPGTEYNSWQIIIDDLDPNMWYLSMGWEKEAVTTDVYNMGLKLYYDRFDNKLYIVSQEVAYGDNGSRIYYYGTFLYGGQKIVLDYDNVRIAEITPINESNTEAQILAQSMSVPGIGEVKFNYGLFYIRESSTSAIAASLAIPEFPWEMKKISELED